MKGPIGWPHCPNGCGEIRFAPAPAHCPECDWEFTISEEQKERLEQFRQEIRDSS